MKRKITTITIYLLILNGVVLSFGITQKVVDLNLFSEDIEAFIWALVASFQLIILFFYLAAYRDEEMALTISIQNIESLLAQIAQAESLLVKGQERRMDDKEGTHETD